MHQRVSDGSRSGDHGFVERKPNLAKIPPDGGAGAEEILGLARGGVTDDLLGCLVDRDFTALYRSRSRQATMALREGSAARLRDALLAEAICAVARCTDEREVMVGLASVFAVALGDVRPDQAGSASGTLNAVQQIASAAGAALISAVYLAAASTSTARDAVAASLVIVLVITALSLAALPLLPRGAVTDMH
jgi:hypothetical protein